jgi:hypothetical protein
VAGKVAGKVAGASRASPFPARPAPGAAVSRSIPHFIHRDPRNIVQRIPHLSGFLPDNSGITWLSSAFDGRISNEIGNLLEISS